MDRTGVGVLAQLPAVADASATSRVLVVASDWTFDGGAAVDDVTSVAQTNPETTVLILLALLVAAIGGTALYRRLTRDPGISLVKLLDGVDEVTVLTHPNPDPDAMASALGVAHIAETHGTTVHLAYPGSIRRQENRAFRTVLELDIEQVESAADLTGEVILVDHGEPRGLTDAGTIDPIAVIDHHPGEVVEASFVDVRPEYGACASIVAEYLQSLGAVPVGPDEISDEEVVVPSPIATGLVYGIQSDTSLLTRGATEADFEAFAYLYPGIDTAALDRITNPEVDREVLEVKARAFSNHEIRGPFAVCDVGELSNVDAIPQAADELRRLEGVTAVIVMGSRNGTLHLSGRSKDDRVHMGQTIESVLDPIPMANGGGHARMGGGTISTDHLNGIGPSEGMSREDLRDRLFEALAGEA